TTNSIQIAQSREKIQHIQQRRTASTVGRSCLANGCTWHMLAITDSPCELRVFTTSSERKAPGEAVVEKPLVRSAGKWPRRRITAASRSGVTADKRDPSCISVNAWTVCAG